jgi:protein-tyrosine-phosphatase
MATTFLRSALPDIQVTSAGTIVPDERHGKMVSEISIKGVNVMKELGHDTSKNIVQRINQTLVDEADMVIIMGPMKNTILPEYLEGSPKLIRWNIPDPGMGDIVHADARDLIKAKIDELVAEINDTK